jgi:L-rhamnose mutarotase
MLLCYDVIEQGGGIMTKLKKRTTIYLDPVLHKALRVKAIDDNKSVSEIINETIIQAWAEDVEDLAAFEERKDEIPISLEEMKKRLKADGII